MKLLQAHYPWQDRLQQQLLRSDTSGHAVLIAGPAGLGKSQLASALARRQLCPETADADCGCRSCRLWQQGNHPDLLYTSPPKADGSIGIAQVRMAAGFLHLSATVSSHRMLVFDRADSMTRPAANALLKTLEEPPAGSCILLTAVQASLLLPTVRSRVTVHALHTPPLAEAIAWCRQRDDSLSEGSLSLLLQLVGGGPLAALKLAADTGGGAMLETLLPQIDEVLQGSQTAVPAAEQWEKQDCQEPALLLLRQLAVSAATHSADAVSQQSSAAAEVPTAWQQCVERASRIPLRALCDLELSGRRALHQLRGGGLNRKWLLVGLLTEWQRQAASL